MQLHLLFSGKVMLNSDKEMKLEYNLTEKYSEEDDTKSCYGVRITKYLDDTVETETVPGISYSREKVVSLLSILFHHQVTPISMIDTLDDLMADDE